MLSRSIHVSLHDRTLTFGAQFSVLASRIARRWLARNLSIPEKEVLLLSATQIPRWPLITAEINADGHVNLVMPDGAHTLEVADVADARSQIVQRAAAYGRDTLRRPVRLHASDPQGAWALAVHPDGTVEEIERLEVDELAAAQLDHAPTPDPEQAAPPLRAVASALNSPSPHAPVAGFASTVPSPPPSGDLDRQQLHDIPPSRLSRLVRFVGRELKSKEEAREDKIEAALRARHVVTQPNIVVISSPKGGPGKTSVSAALGDTCSRYAPNLRILAVDFNPGGGILSLMTPADRGARFTMRDLYHQHEHIRSRAQLQPYVASLPSGLDVLAVPPDPALTVEITPEHYSQLFDSCLLPNYDVLLLDTSPDITTPITQLALERGDQLVIVSEQGYLTAEMVKHSLPYLLSKPAAGPGATRTTMVLNKVITDPRAGRVQTVRENLKTIYSGPIVQIPWDLDLAAAMHAGRFELPQVKARSTRLPIKELALHVLERLI